MNVRKQQNEKERTFLSGYKARITLSITWDLTTFNLLMNQFHSSKKLSYSGFCCVPSDGGSLIALGGKILGRRFLYRGEIDHVLSGKKPADYPVLQKK